MIMSRGYSLLELLVAVTLLVIVSGMAVPIMSSAVDHARAAAAARYLAGKLALSRMDAVKRSTYVALRFESRDGRYHFRNYVDGNGDGLRTTDVARNVDVPQGPPEALEFHFPGVTFGIADGVAPVSPDEELNGDPIRIGRSEFLSFSPLGSATSGTLYIRGRPTHQFAVRILGGTGRITVLRFDFQNRRWIDL
jgi:prepilin-type N-terminal cleavage/methylation domain-containing protein